MSEPPSAAESVVVCRGVTRAYERDGSGGWLTRRGTAGPTVVAIDSVSLSVDRGEFVGITGPSGSGKSTLLHLMAALDTPSEGMVELAGQVTSSLGERARTKLRLSHVGIVFQRFHLLPSLTARGNVALPLVEQGVRRRRRRERAAELLERVGLGDRLEHRPGQLSGGEQQRVAIARALSTQPELILADEPTGELDTETGRRIIDLLASIAEDRSVVVASHDDAVVEAAERVVKLRDGQLVG